MNSQLLFIEAQNNHSMKFMNEIRKWISSDKKRNSESSSILKENNILDETMRKSTTALYTKLIFDRESMRNPNSNEFNSQPKNQSDTIQLKIDAFMVRLSTITSKIREMFSLLKQMHSSMFDYNWRWELYSDKKLIALDRLKKYNGFGLVDGYIDHCTNNDIVVVAISINDEIKSEKQLFNSMSEIDFLDRPLIYSQVFKKLRFYHAEGITHINLNSNYIYLYDEHSV